METCDHRRRRAATGITELIERATGYLKRKRIIRYPKREVVAGIPAGDLMDRNDRARLIWWAECRSRAAPRRRGQSRSGPLTRAYKDVLRALLRFYNSKTRAVVIGSTKLAEEAGVDRSMVFRAIPVLEGLLGMRVWRREGREEREVRPGFWTRLTANAYCFFLPLGLSSLRDNIARAKQSQTATDTSKVKNFSIPQAVPVAACARETVPVHPPRSWIPPKNPMQGEVDLMAQRREVFHRQQVEALARKRGH